MKLVPYWHDTATAVRRRRRRAGGGRGGRRRDRRRLHRPVGGARAGRTRRHAWWCWRPDRVVRQRLRAQWRPRQQRDGGGFRRPRRPARAGARRARCITPMTTPWTRWSASCARTADRLRFPPRRQDQAGRQAGALREDRPQLRAAAPRGRSGYRRWCRRARIRDEVGSDAFHGGLVYRKSAQMHMGRFGAGLADAASRHGARIYEDAPVTRLKRLRGAAHQRDHRPRGTPDGQAGADRDRAQPARPVLSGSAAGSSRSAASSSPPNRSAPAQLDAIMPTRRTATTTQACRQLFPHLARTTA